MFRWGVIGSGFAARKFVLGLRRSKDMKAVLVYSRTERNAQSFAVDLGVGEVLVDLDRAVGSASVDAFYIATPPSEHCGQALACLSQGKPVLIEKPFAPTRADAEAIASKARRCGVFCMEGMWTQFLPLVDRVRKLLAEGAVGEPRSLTASFGVANRPEPSDNQFRSDLGGGALMHRGVYAIAFAFDLLGPADLAASVATIGATGVDEDCSVVLRHHGGALSTLRASLRAPLPNDVSVEGTRGLLRVCPPIFRPFRLELAKAEPAGRGRRGSQFVEAIREGALAQSVQQRVAGSRRGAAIVAHYSGNGYHYEAEEVARCVKEGLTQSERMPLDQSVRFAELMEEARNAWSAPPAESSRRQA